jgi:hypothetical protein
MNKILQTDDELENEFQAILRNEKPKQKPNWKEIIEQGNKEFEADAKKLKEERKKIKKVKKYLKSKNHSSKVINKIESKFEKYEPKISLLDSKIHYRQNQIIEMRFDNKTYKKTKIQKITNDISHYLAKKNINGEMITTLQYDNGFGWKSGHIGDIGNDSNLYDPGIVYDDGGNLDQEKFKKFLVYVIVKPNPRGGNNKNNDCLFDCLDFYLHDRNPWANGANLKKYLGLNRNDKIPISLIPKVESKLKSFQINIIGDYTYSSQVNSNKIISLILQDEHYSVNRNIDNKKTKKHIFYNERDIMLYDKTTYEGYDGKTKRKLTRKEYLEIEQTTNYILINRQEINNKLTIEQEYNKVIETANELKKHSKGVINLYKTGDYKNTALNLFDRFTKYILNPESILQDEFKWLRNATSGAVVFGEKYEGPAYKYDVKSMYPSIYMSYGKIPIKRGEFRTVSQKTVNNMDYYNFGIYRCVVEPSQDKNINKLFKFNKLNYYTHISLEQAKSLNLSITMIEDNQPNNLFYSKDKVIGYNEVFTEYTKFLFELKEKKIPGAKLLLNIIWGALSEIRKYSYSTASNCTIKDDEIITNIYPSINDENILVIKTMNIMDSYVSNFGRLQPFIISKGRYIISEIIKPIKDKVLRCHTDGFISTTNQKINTGSKIGDLVFEGYCNNCEIINCNNVKGEFII